MNEPQKIAILDAGGQYCHLIARKLREIGVFAEVRPSSTSSLDLQPYTGIVISGGPASVYASKRPEFDASIFKLGKPILGICYGHQFMAHELGGIVRRGKVAEYGIARLSLATHDTLFRKLNGRETVWMSHRDVVIEIPKGFEVMARTRTCPVAAMGDIRRKLFGVQFHPEVAHTQRGTEILQAFALDICKCESRRWQPQYQLQRILQEIREKASDKKVFFLVSGGVDSSVAFMLCTEALGRDRVEGLYVDTGLMRKVDTQDIEYLIQEGANIHIEDASQEFLPLVQEARTPEEKRKKIGGKFVEIYERYLGENFSGSEDKWLLGQGTIYPDTIESGGTQYSSKIKTHHNRVSIIQDMVRLGKVIEPLNQFYKDEVRQIGRQLKISRRLVDKQPFPGPGLAVRCIASERASKLEKHLVVSAVAKEYGLFGGKMNLRTVGVTGDERSYQSVAVLAGNVRVSCLGKVSTKITNHAIDINRVVYLLTDETLELDQWQVSSSDVNSERIAILREADELVRGFMVSHQPKLQARIWQFPVILIPFGRLGANRGSIVLRPVDSVDGMTASYFRLRKDVLVPLASLLQKALRVEVLFDVTNKPPATIEWE